MKMKHSYNTGFTLIEFLSVIVLLGIIGTVVTMIYTNSLSAITTQQAVITATTEGQLAIQRMFREIASTRSPTDISTASSSTYAFTDTSGNSITYTLSGSTLTRNGITIANSVNSLTFTYQNKNGSSAGSTSAIRYVTFSINISNQSANYSVTSAVTLRNLLS